MSDPNDKADKADQPPPIRRRTLLGVMAGALGVVLGGRREKPAAAPGRGRRRGFWIGHT